METKKLITCTFKNDTLKEAAELALSHDYRVFIFQKGIIGQIFIVNSTDQTCTISANFGGVSLSSVHRACKACGTGFQIYAELYQVTIDQINEACNCIAPHWSKRDIKNVVKWSSFAEKASSSILEYKEVV